MSVSKIIKDENFEVQFHDDFCVIQDKITHKLKGMAGYTDKTERDARIGLYFLVNEEEENVSNLSKNYMGMAGYTDKIEIERNVARVSICTLWHSRLGHAP